MIELLLVASVVGIALVFCARWLFAGSEAGMRDCGCDCGASCPARDNACGALPPQRRGGTEKPTGCRN